MITAELISYCKEQIASGISSDMIRSQLISDGWSAEDVDEVLGNIEANERVLSAPTAVVSLFKLGAFTVANVVFHLFISFLGNFVLQCGGEGNMCSQRLSSKGTLYQDISGIFILGVFILNILLGMQWRGGSGLTYKQWLVADLALIVAYLFMSSVLKA